MLNASQVRFFLKRNRYLLTHLGNAEPKPGFTQSLQDTDLVSEYSTVFALCHLVSQSSNPPALQILCYLHTCCTSLEQNHTQFLLMLYLGWEKGMCLYWAANWMFNSYTTTVMRKINLFTSITCKHGDTSWFQGLFNERTQKALALQSLLWSCLSTTCCSHCRTSLLQVTRHGPVKPTPVGLLFTHISDTSNLNRLAC